MRYRLVAVAMAGLAVLSAVQGVHAAAKNVILYVVDDQGTTDAGCYGNDVIKTPGLDLLAKHGTRFTHGFCTTASCSASRSVILTGLYNHANGQYGHQHSYHHFIYISQHQEPAGAAGRQGLPHRQRREVPRSAGRRFIISRSTSRVVRRCRWPTTAKR